MKAKKILSAALAAVMIALSAAVPSVAEGNEVHLFIDGNLYIGETILLQGTTYVSLRQFSERFSGARVGWDAGTGTASVLWRGIAVYAREGDGYIEAGGRVLPCLHGVIRSDGKLFVPLRAVAGIFGLSVKWVEGARVVLLTRGEPFRSAEELYADDEVFWLSRIISAEAEGEPFEGKLAVGTVIMNRVASGDYPDTIYGVIFDAQNGVQFTPAGSGTVYCEPGEESVRAAKMCLEGYRTRDDIMFFMNESLAESLWIKNNRAFAVSIGKHDFYA
ncbi:MAG: cell wall hydrolase [Clostridia bacterium]|nr:cell wall hydrolase [Clostridia bacterium]